jgi:hypothetical protein
MSIFNRFFKNHKKSVNHNPRSRKLCIESLESRELLSTYHVDNYGEDWNVAYNANEKFGGWYYFDTDSSKPVAVNVTTFRMALEQAKATTDDDEIVFDKAGTVTLTRGGLNYAATNRGAATGQKYISTGTLEIVGNTNDIKIDNTSDSSTETLKRMFLFMLTGLYALSLLTVVI